MISAINRVLPHVEAPRVRHSFRVDILVSWWRQHRVFLVAVAILAVVVADTVRHWEDIEVLRDGTAQLALIRARLQEK